MGLDPERSVVNEWGAKFRLIPSVEWRVVIFRREAIFAGY
jgi:hypothetical protein